ncbi:MAG TPA: GntR family transcriptional regulator [Pirellulales bacterium]|nr:GntR family transcriptional regulator [Pirellulales bacterium]
MPIATSTAPLQNVSEQIAAQLRLELMTGGFRPGESLREEALAERFGVSRHPIRKVLQQLVQDGFLVAKRNCGVRVAHPPGKHVCELLSPMRAQMETYALRLAFERLRAEDFQGFEPILARLRFACEQGDAAAVWDRDFEFHKYLLEAADLQDVIPIWLSITGRLRDFHATAIGMLDDLLSVHFVHQVLIETFRSGDLEQASAALAEHVVNGTFNVEAKQRFKRKGARRNQK